MGVCKKVTPPLHCGVNLRLTTDGSSIPKSQFLSQLSILNIWEKEKNQDTGGPIHCFINTFVPYLWVVVESLFLPLPSLLDLLLVAVKTIQKVEFCPTTRRTDANTLTHTHNQPQHQYKAVLPYTTSISFHPSISFSPSLSLSLSLGDV